MVEEDLTPEERFAIHINKAMVLALQDDADEDVVAKICINTARELYDHYGAGGDHDNYLEFVVSTGFETAEIEEYLDWLEGRRPLEDE